MKIKNLKLKINQKGFTLIELLVVIAIIGILASFAIASFTSAQAKGRDSRRKSDLDAIKKALELAKGDSSNGAYYPGCTTSSPCDLSAVATIPPLTTAYIRAVPSGPSSTGTCTLGYKYCYVATVGSYAASTYQLQACLENGNEPSGGYVTTVAATRCVSTKLYTVTEP